MIEGYGHWKMQMEARRRREELDEISKKKTGEYLHKAVPDLGARRSDIDYPGTGPASDMEKHDRRSKYITKAINKLSGTKAKAKKWIDEQRRREELDELSSMKLLAYSKKARASADKLDKMGDKEPRVRIDTGRAIPKGIDRRVNSEVADDKILKRHGTYNPSIAARLKSKYLKREEVELDEISLEKTIAYAKKNHAAMNAHVGHDWYGNKVKKKQFTGDKFGKHQAYQDSAEKKVKDATGEYPQYPDHPGGPRTPKLHKVHSIGRFRK